MRRIVLVLAVLVAGLLPLGASPAFACSCAWSEVQQYVENADHVVVGRLQDQQYGRSEAGEPIYSSEAAYYTVEGDEVLKGDGVAPTFEVVSAASGAACGLERMVVGRRYVFFMQRDDDVLTASLCGGTGPATPSFLSEVKALTGPGAAVGGVLLSAAAELREALAALTIWR